MNQSKINAGGINQQTMNAVTATTANKIKINVQSINIQCALNQQPMRIASDSLMPGFSSPKTFTLSSMSPIPVILRGAEGEVAESILLESTLSQDVWDDHLQSSISLYERSNSSPQRVLSLWERGNRLRWVRVKIPSKESSKKD